MRVHCLRLSVFVTLVEAAAVGGSSSSVTRVDGSAVGESSLPSAVCLCDSS